MTERRNQLTTAVATNEAKPHKVDPHKLRVAGWRLLIERISKTGEDKSDGGIVLPHGAREDKATTLARIIKIGTGRVTEQGVTIPITGYNEGDIILVGKYAGTPIGRDDSNFRIINEPEVLAVLEG